MRIYLDDRPVDCSATTLAGAIECVVPLAGDRLLIEAHADGRVLTAEELTDRASTEPYSAQELRFRSADPVDLARVTLHDAGVAVGALSGRHLAVADLIESGASHEANAGLSELFAVWGGVLGAVDLISRTPGIPWPPKSEVVDQSRLDDATRGLMSLLGEVKSSLGAGDAAGLCDILRYELDEQAVVWQSLCNELADAMSDASRESR